MKRLITLTIAVLLCPVASAFAQATDSHPAINVLFGVIRAQNVALEAGNSNLVSASGPMFLVDFDIPVRARTSIVPRFNIFTATSAAIDFSGVAAMDYTAYQIEALFRVYTADAGRARGFMEVGPSINRIGADVVFTPIGGSLTTGSDAAWKAGFTFGGGAEIPITKRVHVQALGEYAFIAKFNNSNASNIRVLGGIGFLLGKL